MFPFCCLIKPHSAFVCSRVTVVQKSQSSYSLMWVSFGVLRPTVLQTIPPRACLTALSFCQPFLINHAITLSQEQITDETTQKGYGLIGAYFLVYVGIAVGSSSVFLFCFCSLLSPT